MASITYIKKDYNIFSLIILALYAIAIVALACFHEPWYDELQAWYIAVRNNPVEIFGLMKDEGHFMLWSMLLYPFAKMGMSSVVGLPIVSCAFMIWAAWLLLYRSPFNRWTCIFILVSYPVLFYYSIVSRCYAMIPPLLFMLALYYPKRHTRPIAYGVILGLLYNTHVYIEGFTITMSVLWICEIWKAKRTDHGVKREIIGLAIALALGLFAFLQIADIVGLVCQNMGQPFVNPMSMRDQTVEIVDGWTPFLSDFLDLEFVWQVPYLHAILKWIIVLCVLVLNIWVVKSNCKMLLIFLISLAYMLVFSHYLYPMTLQRTMMPYFIVLFCLWIGNIPEKKAMVYTGIFAACTAFSTITEIYNDICHPYDGYLQIHHEMVKDNNPDTYIYSESHLLQLPIHCFGPDTIANAQMYRTVNELCQKVEARNSRQCVVYMMNWDWKNYSEFEQRQDSIIYEMDAIGYTLEGTMPKIYIIDNYLGCYTFQKRKSNETDMNGFRQRE